MKSTRTRLKATQNRKGIHVITRHWLSRLLGMLWSLRAAATCALTRRHVMAYSNGAGLRHCTTAFPVLFLSKSAPRSFLSAAKENDNQEITTSPFRKGDKIQVEVKSFGQLGASVDIIAHHTHDLANCLPESELPLGQGLILQREIAYFRAARQNVDVVNGEVLPAFVERVREDTGRVDVSLRPVGGVEKANAVSDQIMAKLEQQPELPVGDKSSPDEIAAMFPGVSKSSFKRAVSNLYKQGRVIPGEYLVKKTPQRM